MVALSAAGQLKLAGTIFIDSGAMPSDIRSSAPDSWFSHLAVECNPSINKNTWLESVSDADYKAATAKNDK